MNFEQIKTLEDQHVIHSYGRHPVAIDHGKGATLWDTEGKEYIDFTSGIGVTSLGHGNEGWVKAVTDQAGVLLVRHEYLLQFDYLHMSRRFEFFALGL